MKRLFLSLLLTVFAGFVLTACPGSGSGGAVHEDGPLVVTVLDNVNAPEGEEVVSVPFGELTSKWDAWFRDAEGNPLEVVIVPEGWVIDLTNKHFPVIHLDSNATKDLLSDSVVDALGGVAGTIYPPLLPFIPLVGLFFKRFRRHTGNMVKNLTPGVKGTNGAGKGIDLAEAAKDALRLAGLLDSSRQDRDALALTEDFPPAASA